jgi:hypothetical protein
MPDDVVAPVLHGFPVPYRASETGTLKQKERSPTQASPVPGPLLSCRGHVRVQRFWYG